MGCAQARCFLQILDADRQAMQAAERLTVQHGTLGLLGGLARTFFVERDNGVEGRVGLGNALKTTVEEFDRRQLLDANQSAGFDSAQITGFRHIGIFRFRLYRSSVS